MTIPSKLAPRLSVERPLPGTVSPADVLRVARGRERGFWARGEAWIAHFGSVDDLAAGPGSEGERFDVVAEEAARIWGAHGTSRLFGGFAFSSSHKGRDAWDGFPAGRFVSPAVEVEVGAEGRVPVLRVYAGVGATVEELERGADRWLAKLKHEIAHREDGGAPSSVGRKMGPRVTGLDPEDWSASIEDALRTIRREQASKIVVARTLDLEPAEPVDAIDVVMALWEENKGSHVFLFEPEPGKVLVGAAPETVATVADGRFRATAVAGSVGVGSTSVETAALARRLFESRKDRAEQKFVVDHMVTQLQAHGCQVHVDVEPHVLTLARIQHLETKIAAEVPDEMSVLDLLKILHPTPAVCGVPRDAALTWLENGEPFDRGWYAGPVGWFDAEGRGVFVPALRSAVYNQGVWRLFAGCGIVEGSDPEAEWYETGMKFQPVLRALVRAGMSPEVLERAA